jgi:hypothetical protein
VGIQYSVLSFCLSGEQCQVDNQISTHYLQWVLKCKLWEARLEGERLEPDKRNLFTERRMARYVMQFIFRQISQAEKYEIS